MDERKYEFTGEIRYFWDKLYHMITLHRIRACHDFDDVKSGDLGGWVESENNLSYYGLSWIYDDGVVFGNGHVSDHAKIRNDAIVCGNAYIGESAKICQDALIMGESYIVGDAVVGGRSVIDSNPHIHYGAQIRSTNDVLTIGPIGSRDDYATFYRNRDGGITVNCGYFCGDIDYFLCKVRHFHKDNKHAKTYSAAAELAKIQILSE